MATDANDAALDRYLDEHEERSAVNVLEEVAVYVHALEVEVMDRATKLPVAVDIANVKGPGQKDAQIFMHVRRAEMAQLETLVYKLKKILEN